MNESVARSQKLADRKFSYTNILERTSNSPCSKLLSTSSYTCTIDARYLVENGFTADFADCAQARIQSNIDDASTRDGEL